MLPPARGRVYAGRRLGGAVRPEDDYLADATFYSAAVRRHVADATVYSAAVRRPPEGPCAPITGGQPSSAGPTLCPTGRRPNGAVRPEYDCFTDATVYFAAVARLASGGDLVLPSAQCRAHVGCHPGRGSAPCSLEACHPHMALRRAHAGRRLGGGGVPRILPRRRRDCLLRRRRSLRA